MVTLGAVTNCIKTNQKKKKIVIDRLMIFHGIIISKLSDYDLKEYFKYELSNRLSLFSEKGILRKSKGTKSTLQQHGENTVVALTVTPLMEI